VGLIGEDPAAELAASATSLAAGEIDAATSQAAEARDAWRTASEVGTQRALLGGGGLLLLILGGTGTTLLVRRRRRQGAAATLHDEEAGADESAGPDTPPGGPA
jgi:hypothetical protein